MTRITKLTIKTFGNILLAIAFGLGPQELIAQGPSPSTFIFRNYIPSAGPDAPVFDADGNRLSGTNYVAMLYGGPTLGSLAPAWTAGSQNIMPPVAFFDMPNGGSGYFVYSSSQGSHVELPNVLCGDFAWLQVVAWDLRVAPTYEDAISLGIGGYGASSPFRQQGGGLCTVLPTLPAPLSDLQSFSLLQVVPEPSTWALLLLGLPALWWFRRPSRPVG